MDREPNLIISSASKHIVEDDVSFKVDICKLEGGDGWSLEVVTADGTSTDIPQVACHLAQ